jgi:hypothetical protein
MMMTAAPEQVDDSSAMLEDYRATVTELRGNLKRLKELVEEQILLETPPRLRERQSTCLGYSTSSSPAE